MTWVRLDDSMTEHPKIAALSNAAFRLHVEGLCYCARALTDGVIPSKIARKLGTPRSASELVSAGVWDAVPAGFEVHDYHDFQPTKAEVLDLRAKRAEAGRKGGQISKPRSKIKASASSKTEATGDEAKRNPVPSRPLDTDSLRSSVSQAVEPRARNEQWDGLAAVFGYSASGSEAALWGKLVKQLAEFGANKPSIEEAGRRYLLDMPTVTRTPSALVKHYQRLMASPVSPRLNGHRSAADNTLELARQAREREIHAGQ